LSALRREPRTTSDPSVPASLRIPEADKADLISVLLADDHPAIRAGVRAALEAGDFWVCAEASSAPEAVQAARQAEPKVCLLDIEMPGNGITAARQITSSLPATAVVMLTVSSRDSDLFEALLAGARGYLLKDIDPDRLPHALALVLAGEAPLPRALAGRLVTEFRAKERRRLRALNGRRLQLTHREWEVLELMRQGSSTADISRELFIAKDTVRSHISRIMEKLCVPDRKAAIRLIEGR
jgi:DNA-binding NarL/FixJ family response regulator